MVSLENQNSLRKLSENVGFIGGGNMAKAIFDGIIKKGVLTSSQIYVSGPTIENLAYFKEKGVNITTSNGHVVDTCNTIFICVKPQILQLAVEQIMKEHKSNLKEKIFVSILSGISIEKIEKTFNTPIKLVRLMPNTPLAVGEGCSVYAPNDNIDENSIVTVTSLLQPCGLFLKVQEKLIDSIAALSGSGPGFMYLILEAFADGGVKMGIPRSEARKLAAQTMLGSAKMVLETGKHTAQLRDEVCSAGGTTIAGIHALEKGGVRGAIMDAIEATTKKAKEH